MTYFYWLHVDLFYDYDYSNIAHYADNTTPYACGEKLPALISELQSSGFRLFNGIENKHMKANTGKSHILLSNKKNEEVTVKCWSKLHGITHDSELRSEEHITGTCNKASQKIHVLSRRKVTCRWINRDFS